MKKLLITTCMIVQTSCLFSDSSDPPSFGSENNTTNSGNNETNNAPGNNATNNSNPGNNANNNSMNLEIDTDIVATDILVLDGDPFHIIIADDDNAEVWTYGENELSLLAQFDSRTPISAAKIRDDDFYVASAEGVRHCTPGEEMTGAGPCPVTHAGAIAVVVESGELETIQPAANGFTRHRESGLPVAIESANTPVTRSFWHSNSGWGGLLTTSDGLFTIFTGEDNETESFEEDYTRAIPIGEDRFVALLGSELVSVNMNRSNDQSHARNVTAFDAYRYNNDDGEYYLAYAAQGEIVVLQRQGSDDVSVAGVSNTGRVQALGFAVRDETILVVFANDNGRIELRQLTH